MHTLDLTPALFQALFEGSDEGIGICNEEGSLVYVNGQICSLHGYTQQELLGMSFGQLVPESHRKGLFESFQRFMQGSGHAPTELTGIKKSGDTMTISLRANRLVQPDGTCLCVSFMRDISAYKRTELELTTITNNIPALIFRYKSSPGGFSGISYVSEGATGVWGISAQECMTNGQLFLNRVDPEYRQLLLDSFRQAALHSDNWECTWKYHHPDGSLRWQRGMGNPSPQLDGSIVWDSLVLDITDLKTAQLDRESMARALKERVKEQSCLYRISRLANEALGISQALQRSVEIIPHGWQFPQYCQARITYDGMSYNSTEWAVVSMAIRTFRQVGDKKLELEVAYSHGPQLFSTLDFLSDEYELLETIADNLALHMGRLETSTNYRLLLETTEEGIYGIDTQGKCTFINHAAALMLGYGESECIGSDMHALIHRHKSNGEPHTPDDCPIYQAMCLQQTVRASDDIFWKRDGSSFPVRYSSTPIIIDNECKGAVVVFDSIAAQKEAQEKIDLQARRFSALVGEAHELVTIVDAQGNYQYVSPSYSTQFGYDIPELIGTNAFNHFHPNDLSTVLAQFSQFASTSFLSSAPYRFRRKDGTWRWLQSRGTDLSQDPAVGGIVVVSTDITAIMEVQAELSRANERFELIMRENSECICDHDPQTNQLYLSHGFNRIFGLEPAGLDDNRDLINAHIHPDDRQTVIDNLVHTLHHTHLDRWQHEYRLQRSDGSYALVQDRAFIIRDHNGTPTRVLAVIKDISRAHFYEQLGKLEKEVLELSVGNDMALSDLLHLYITRLEGLMGDMRGAILQVKDGKLQHFVAPNLPSRYIAQMNGIEIGEGRGSCGTAAFRAQGVLVANVQQDPLWTNIKHLGTEYGFAACYSYPIFNHDKLVVGVIANYYGQAHEPTHAEIETLERSQRLISLLWAKYHYLERLTWNNQRYELINKASNEAIFEWDVDADAYTWGDGYQRLFGQEPGGPPATLEQWAQRMYPIDHERLQTKWEYYVSDPNQTDWRESYRFARADGSYAHVEETGYLLRDQYGKPTRMVGVLRDISESVEMRQLMENASRLSKIGAWQYDLRTGQHLWDQTTREILEIPTPYNPSTIESGQFYSTKTYSLIESTINASLATGRPFDLEFPIMTYQGREKWVHAMGQIEMHQEKPIRITGSVQDIHERKVLEIKLEGQTRLLKALLRVIEILLQANDWRQALDSCLQWAGEAVGADRAYFFDHAIDARTGQPTFSQYAEWTRPGVKPFLTDNRLQNIGIHDYAPIGEALLDQGLFTATQSQLPEGSLKAICTEQEVQSLLLLAITIDGVPQGIIGFDDCSTEREWLDGEVDFLHAIASNLSVAISRQQDKDDLRQSLQEKTSILESIGDGFFTLDRHWIVRHWNRAAEEIMGTKREDILGRHLWDEVVMGTHSPFHHRYQLAMDSQQPINFEERSTTTHKWLDVSAYPNPGGLSVYFRDVTARHEQQDTIAYHHRLLQALNTCISLFISYGNWREVMADVCQTVGKALGVDRVYYFDFHKRPHDGAILASQRHEWVKEGIKPELDNEVMQGMEVDELPEFFTPILWGHGFISTVEDIHDPALKKILQDQEILSLAVLPANANGESVGFMGFDDCTTARTWQELEVSFLKNILSSLASSIERHQAQAHLKTLFDDRNRIIESIDDGFFVIDRDYTVSMWNKEAARILSYQHDEIIGKKLTQFIDKEVFYNFYRWFDDAFAKKVTTHFEEQSATTGRWYDVSVYPEGERLSVFFRDISSQKKLEQALRSSNERFEKVTQATQDAIWDWDLPSKSILWGTGYYTMFGYGVDGPQAFDLWKERIHPDDIQRVTNSLEQALYGLGDPGAEKWQCEFRFRRADGSYAHVIDMGLVLRNEAGDATRMVGAMNDISHRKEYEASLQALNEQLEMNVEELAKSNHELEQFAYIASHDLQEPLRMVSSFLEQLRKKYDNELDDRAQTYIHYAVDGAARMRQIILDLLDFSRVGKFTDPPTPVSLAQVVGEATLLLGEQVKESQARIRHEGLPVVQGHKSALVQIMQNLLGNAIKYARKETPPQIEVRAAEEKDQWAISVSDNGIGIDPAYTEKVFLLFQKLHRREEYPGTGMGLAIVKKNVELMGGKVWVESNLGQGATFIFTLPKNIKKSIHKKGKHETSA